MDPALDSALRGNGVVVWRVPQGVVEREKKSKDEESTGNNCSGKEIVKMASEFVRRRSDYLKTSKNFRVVIVNDNRALDNTDIETMVCVPTDYFFTC